MFNKLSAILWGIAWGTGFNCAEIMLLGFVVLIYMTVDDHFGKWSEN